MDEEGAATEEFEIMKGYESVRNEERALIEQLIGATRLYDSCTAIQDLFDFAIRFRRFAPFNAMLLHIQKPGLTFAATAADWKNKFGRWPKQYARPLLILRTMGPVDFVFDIQDTEGRAIPPGVFSFPTLGNLTERRLADFFQMLARIDIDVCDFDAGDAKAGAIWMSWKSDSPNGKNSYMLSLNRNHSAPTRFVTVAHELAHLFLGHLGADEGRRVRNRSSISVALQEAEAEMTAYLVAKRNGLEPRSESYLAKYQGEFEDLNLYGIARAANAVEAALGISASDLSKEDYW
ncbi:MAG: ImmA/IrrE family metallo-endopeptidase [Albidovulum sp.]|nr:ImmA/IrrE family metallo-endopeptidase [Albidovulum sp.]